MTQTPERRPRIIGWGITNQCNLTCPHCFTASGNRAFKGSTTLECFRIIDSMTDIGVSTIGWTGGEPLLRSDLEDLIAYARQKKIRSTITTNGILLNERRAARLTKAGNRVIQISLDGSTPERNRTMRGASGEEYRAILEAIRICKRMNNRVILATVLGRENLDDGPAMIELAKRERVDTIRFCGYAPIGRGKHPKVKERLDFTNCLTELLRFIEHASQEREVVVDFDIGLGPTPPDYSFHECVAGLQTFYLDAAGDVYPCTSLTFREFRVGNVREKSLEGLWNSPAMVEASISSERKLKGHCVGCDNVANCHGACRGAVFAHTGDLQASFPHCLYRVAQTAVRSQAER